MRGAYLVRYRRPMIITAHLLVLPVIYFLAFAVRFDGDVPSPYLSLFVATAGIVVLTRAVVFGMFRLYQGWWRYVGAADLKVLILAVSVSTAAYVAILFVTGKLDGLPRSIILLDWMLTLAILGGGRFMVRSLREEPLLNRTRRARQSDHPPVIILGAGTAGERLVRDLLADDEAKMRPVALLDDDVLKHGMRIHRVPVAGCVTDLPHIAAKTGATTAILAIPSASKEEITEILRECRKAGVRCQIVPSLFELVTGTAKLTETREVRIEDLLGRDSVSLELDSVRESLEGEIVMVTGGAGSIGSEICRQVAALNPKRLVILDQAESPLYFIHLEVAKAHPELDVVPVICDITDKPRLRSVFDEHQPKHVFHAAAYKHVPLMEGNVVEAVRNNILGTLHVAECAADYDADRFVLISTDKAVRPSSVMGATKRIAERIVLGWPSLRESNTDFRAVRFGNVLGSNGSVIPLFKQQLAVGGPLTVTHPDVTRFFMTIPEACQLVLTAGTLPEAAGHICMLEMGEPVKIVDLAENLIRLSGLEPHVDVEIHYTGLRPGEKLYEELMGEVETTVPTRVKKINVVATDEPESESLKTSLARLVAAMTQHDRADMLASIRALVPECVAPLREGKAKVKALDINFSDTHVDREAKPARTADLVNVS